MTLTLFFIVALIAVGAYRVFAERRAGRPMAPWVFGIAAALCPLLSNFVAGPVKVVFLAVGAGLLITSVVFFIRGTDHNREPPIPRG
jgi:hypothetical protein